jgi:hypothetical protein
MPQAIVERESREMLRVYTSCPTDSVREGVHEVVTPGMA